MAAHGSASKPWWPPLPWLDFVRSSSRPSALRCSSSNDLLKIEKMPPAECVYCEVSLRCKILKDLIDSRVTFRRLSVALSCKLNHIPNKTLREGAQISIQQPALTSIACRYPSDLSICLQYISPFCIQIKCLERSQNSGINTWNEVLLLPWIL